MLAQLIHIIQAGGFVMYPLLLLSVVAVAVIVERLIAFKQYGAASPRLLAFVLAAVRGGRPQDALERCENEPGPLAACMAVIIRRRDSPIPDIERRVEETGQEYFLRLERFLPFLDTTTTVAPLLGLLGTIVGMVGTFNAIATARDQSKTDAVMAGVGEALYATAAGLIVAIISFLAYNFFTARLRTITETTELGATKLLNALGEGEEGSALERHNHAGPARVREGARSAV